MRPTAMIFDPMERHPGARFLFILACLVVVVYGLKFAAPILVPSATALFLAVVSLPIMLFLRHRRVPALIAIPFVVLLNVAVFGLLILLLSQSLAELQTQLPRYALRLQEIQNSWIEWLEVRSGMPFGDQLPVSPFDPAAMVELARLAIGRIASFVSATFLVFIIMAFMLAEANIIPDKFRYVLGEAAGSDERLAKFVLEVQSYLGIKTAVSLATGFSLGLWCYFSGLDFPVLLGMIAFVLNYVPTVGSIIASFPAVLLSLILYGTIGNAVLVVTGYFVVNTLLGSVLEPHLQGRRLGLSTLVVVLSLLFWGWAWGAIGALLSVPLTVIVKVWLENTRDLRWVAVMLDKGPPQPRGKPTPFAEDTAA